MVINRNAINGKQKTKMSNDYIRVFSVEWKYDFGDGWMNQRIGVKIVID